MTRRLLSILLALTSVSCLEVADDRAAFDQTIGQAQSGVATVSVADGLGHVLAFSGDRTELWSQAPSLDVTLQLPIGSHTLTARNTLADAEWIVEAPGGPVTTVVVEEELPTVKTVRFSNTGGPITARLRAPDADDTSRWRFVAFADVQDKIDGVQDIYAEMAADDTIRFGLISGDLTEQGSREELIRFQKEMEALPFPLYATLGNHELGVGDLEFQRRFGRANFSFEFRGVRFTLVDSGSATLSPLVWGWLDGWLEAGSDKAHVFLMHIPPFDPAGTRNGGWASREEAGFFNARLGRADVDLAIYGHIHTFLAYEVAGVPSYITGGGGAIPQRLDGIGRHFLTVEVDPETQRFEVALVRVD